MVGFAFAGGINGEVFLEAENGKIVGLGLEAGQTHIVNAPYLTDFKAERRKPSKQILLRGS
ncbi:hypothetical protein J2TS6_04790 [Paenibacillus albilobatus]|uniref:Uncharacterized protein n=1 Tax=Paenibacillus albilobatus TaxID=2716884 RepID=A0A920C924_9BACL|nr:hypothetical protein J2TS6_04790 [Paenibacillus albilobatus]